MVSKSNSNTNSNSNPNIDIGSPYTPRRSAPIVSISINHPIATAFRKIKNFLTHKQTLFSTSFTIKITPIVAIVSLLGLATLFGGGITTAFTLGKTVEEKFLSSLPSPTPKVIISEQTVISVSKVGIIKATYQLPPSPTQKTESTDAVKPVSTSGEITLPSPTPVILHYILVPPSGSIIFLSSSIVSFQNYVNHKVLITGSLDSIKNILTVLKPGDIEVLQ